jgi:hypothetical protein
MMKAFALVTTLSAACFGIFLLQSKDENRRLFERLKEAEREKSNQIADTERRIQSLQTQLINRDEELKRGQHLLADCQHPAAAQPAPTQTTTASPDYRARLRGFLTIFGDTLQVALITPRYALAPQIEKLQGIRRDTANGPWPPELVASANYALQGEDAVLRALLKLTNDGNQAEIEREFRNATAAFTLAKSRM